MFIAWVRIFGWKLYFPYRFFWPAHISKMSFLFTIIACFIKCRTIFLFVTSVTIVTQLNKILCFGGISFTSGKMSFLFLWCLMLFIFAITWCLCSEVVSRIFVCLFVSSALCPAWIILAKVKSGRINKCSLSRESLIPHIKTCCMRLSVMSLCSLSFALWQS